MRGLAPGPRIKGREKRQILVAPRHAFPIASSPPTLFSLPLAATFNFVALIRRKDESTVIKESTRKVDNSHVRTGEKHGHIRAKRKRNVFPRYPNPTSREIAWARLSQLEGRKSDYVSFRRSLTHSQIRVSDPAR